MAKIDETDDSTAPKVAVTLKLHHNHAGQQCKPGDTIHVSTAQQVWLASRGIINTPETH